MSTALLAVIVSIILSHSIPELGRLRHYGWFEAWLRGDFNPLAGGSLWSGRFGGWWSVGLPVLIVALLQILFAGRAYGFPSFLLAMVVLFYCWGPRDLDADIAAVTHANWFAEHASSSWWGVPLAVVIGVPLYSNAAGVLPLVEVLHAKGVPMGTVLAFMMSVVALSTPEMILLRRVLKPQLIATYFGVVAAGILATGYVFNLIT